MEPFKPVGGRIDAWRELKRKIRLADQSANQSLLAHCGDEIRRMLREAAAASGDRGDSGTGALVPALSVVAGGWMTADPYNPSWPGRDRLFAFGGDVRAAACAMLAVVGFFAPESVNVLAEAVSADRDIRVPGLEPAAAKSGTGPEIAWADAVKSRDWKSAWRGSMENGGPDWVDPEWLASPAMWRTCVLLDHDDPAAVRCCELPQRRTDRPAGLEAVVFARDDAGEVATAWRNSGWDSELVAGNDVSGLYRALAAPARDVPLAIVVDVGETEPR